MGDGPKRSPLNRKGPQMGYSVRDSVGYTGTTIARDEVFYTANSLPPGWQPAHSLTYSPRRYHSETRDDGRAPVYVPCNIPRWYSGPSIDQNREPVSGQHGVDRYVDLSTRDGRYQEPVFIGGTSPHQWLQKQNPNGYSPGHYVDLDLATSREPVLHTRGQYSQPRPIPCQYAELDFDAIRSGIQGQAYHLRPDGERYMYSYGVPSSMSINYGFPSAPSFDSISQESVGCQADLEDNDQTFAPSQDSSDYDQSPKLTTFRGLSSPYSEIPVYRRAYDQFRSPVSSPYRVAPGTEGQGEIKPYTEGKSPKKQKGKKHRVSFKVILLPYLSSQL